MVAQGTAGGGGGPGGAAAVSQREAEGVASGGFSVPEPPSAEEQVKLCQGLNLMALQTVGAEFVARKKIDKGMDRGARNIYSGVRTQMRTLEFGLKE